MDARDKPGDPSIVPARGSRHTLPRRSAQPRRAGVRQQPSLQPQRLVRGSVQRDFLPVQRLCPFAVVLLCPLIILSVPLLTLGLYQFPFSGVPQNHDIHLCVFTVFSEAASYVRHARPSGRCTSLRRSFPTCWSPPLTRQVVKLTMFCCYCCFK